MSSQKKPVSSASGETRNPKNKIKKPKKNANDSGSPAHGPEDEELEVVFLKNEKRIKDLEKLVSNLSQIVDPTGSSNKKKKSYGDTSSSKI